MPLRLEKCVEKVKKTITPRKKGQTKESAAYAVCTAAQYNPTGKKGSKK